MMTTSGFDDVSLDWAGKTYVIKGNRRLMAIARIEEHITLGELNAYWARHTAPMARLAAAFGSVLRYAGATVTDEDVYCAMFPGGADNPQNVRDAITTLIAMIIPPTAQKALTNGGGNGGGTPLPGKAKPAAAGSSKRRSRHSSDQGI